MDMQLLMGDKAYHILTKVSNMKVKTNALFIKYYFIEKFLAYNMHVSLLIFYKKFLAYNSQ